MYVFLFALALVAILILARYVVVRLELEGKANGTFAERYIYIESDGTSRALTANEVSHLNTVFEPGDGARPYIKSSYLAHTPTGDLSGYLLRRHLPSHIPLKEIELEHFE